MGAVFLRNVHGGYSSTILVFRYDGFRHSGSGIHNNDDKQVDDFDRHDTQPFAAYTFVLPYPFFDVKFENRWKFAFFR